MNTRSECSDLKVLTMLFTVVIFAMLCLLAIAVRDQELLLGFVSNEILISTKYSEYGRVCSAVPACLRIFDSWIGLGIEELLLLGASLLDFLPLRHYPTLVSISVKESYLLSIGGLFTRMIVLSPIFFVAIFLFKSSILRIITMILLFMSLYGWARSGPLFAEQAFAHYDYSAIGFILLLFVLMARGTTEKFWKAALVLSLGQLVFENMGIVVGVGVAMFYFLNNREDGALTAMIGGFWRLAGMATVSIVMLLFMIGLITYANDGMVSAVGEGGFFEYFASAWERYGKVNFHDFHDIRENFFVLLAYPVAGGILLGILGSVMPGEERHDLEVLRYRFNAGLSIWIGFMCTLVPAMFLSGLYYEMGRQLLPLCVITTIFAAMGTMYMLAIVGRRWRRDPQAAS